MILTPGGKTGFQDIGVKKIMDLFEVRKEYPSYELKKDAGFGKGGEKNFSGVVTELQMQTYLVTRDFDRRGTAKVRLTGWLRLSM